MPRALLLATVCVVPTLVPAEAAAQRTPPVYAAALAPDGTVLARSFAFIESPGHVTFCDPTSGKEQFVCKGHRDAINAMVFSPDGKMLATGDWRGDIRVWDRVTGKLLANFQHEPEQVWSLAISPNSKVLVSSSPSRILLWELATGNRRAVIQPGGGESATFGQHAGCHTVFSPDGRTFACAANNGIVRHWDALTLRERPALVGRGGPVRGVAFTPDSQTVATISRDGTVRLWNAATGGQRALLSGHKGPGMAVAFSPDGRMLASWCYWMEPITEGKSKGNDRCGTQLKIWEVTTGQERLTFEPDQPQTNWWRNVFALQFSGDGQKLLTVSVDLRTITRWDLAKLARRPQ